MSTTRVAMLFVRGVNYIGILILRVRTTKNVSHLLLRENDANHNNINWTTQRVGRHSTDYCTTLTVVRLFFNSNVVDCRPTF